MRVLFLTQVLPYPLNAGPKVRAYYMLRQLASRFEVTLVSFVRQDDQAEDVAHLREICHAVYTVPIRRSRSKAVGALLQSLASGEPAVIIRDRDAGMARLLGNLAASGPFQIVHADQTSMAEYALLAAGAHRGSRPKLVLDQHNALYLLVRRQARLERGPQRLIWRRESRLLEKYEAGLCRRFDHILTVTEEDEAALARLLDEEEAAAFRAKTTAIPICIDPAERPLLPSRDEGPQIIHLGTMFWPPNIEGVLWFAREVMPLVWPRVPDARLVIAGKEPAPEIKALADEGRAAGHEIQVTGYVADPDPLLQRSQVFIVPVRAGGGMRVKILDGWLAGVPVVSTTVGAEGIEVRPGENILLADTAEAYADAVVALLQDPALRSRLRANGRRWVEARYDWRRRYPAVEAIYLQLLDGGLSR